MDPDVLRSLRLLLTSHRVLSLAVLVDGVPEAGMLPYALRPDFGGAYVQASGLARHTRGLMPGVRVGLLVHANDTPESDPMQLPRLAVQAAVRLLARDSGAFAAAGALFIARFPAAATTLSLGDFNLYELTFERGRFVKGFARAVNVGPDTFAELAALT